MAAVFRVAKPGPRGYPDAKYTDSAIFRTSKSTKYSSSSTACTTVMYSAVVKAAAVPLGLNKRYCLATFPSYTGLHVHLCPIAHY